MTSKERIQNSIRLLNQYINELNKIFPDNYETYKDSLIIRRSSERQIQIIIEQINDICAMLYRYACSGLAGDELTILEKLSEDCLSHELCEKIRHMKGFRNILVHGYASLNDTLVYNNIFYGRADIFQFMEEVEDCINKI